MTPLCNFSIFNVITPKDLIVNHGNTIISYNNNKQNTILAVDDSNVIRKMLNHYLDKNNYNIILAKDGAEALKTFDTQKIDLLITDINMPQMGGFELLFELRQRNYNPPYIMITDSDINKYLELAIENQVGNILSKPLNESELLNTVYKLLYPETLFGLKNYLYVDENTLHTINVSSSQQCEDAVKLVLEKANDLGLESDFIPSLRLILSEMAINALYHPHGLTHQKEERQSVQLKDGDKIKIQYGVNEEKFGVSIADFEGKLTKLVVLSTFKEFFESNQKMMKAIEMGEDPTEFIKDKGRGLQMAREMSNEYYFNIKSNEITEIIIITWLKKNSSNSANQSIKINEIN